MAARMQTPSRWLACSLLFAGCLAPERDELVSTTEHLLLDCDVQCQIDVPCGQPCCEQCGACSTLPCTTPGCSTSFTTAIDDLIEDRGYTGPACTPSAPVVTIGGHRTKDCVEATVVYNPAPQLPQSTGCAYALSKASGAVAIRNAWMTDPAARGALGAPSAELSNDGGGKLYQRFARGVLTRRAGSSTAYYLGSPTASLGIALRGKWLTVRDQVGYPTESTRSLGPNGIGAGNPLSPGAAIYASPADDEAHVVSGLLQTRYTATAPFFPQRWYDAPRGWLGFPTADQVDVVSSGHLVGQLFEHGSISGAPSSGVATTSSDPLARASLLQSVHPDPLRPGRTIRFRLSGMLVKPGCANDRDGDCLDQANENQLAFLAAPRIFWDEDEATSEHADPLHWKRLDLVQVRPITTGDAVSTWTDDSQWKRIAIHYLMPYPMQVAGHGLSTHVGDNELVVVELSSRNLRDWYLDRAVYTHHGTSTSEPADFLAGIAAELGTSYLSVAADEDAHGSWPGRDADSGDCAGDADDSPIGHVDCFAPSLTAYTIPGSNLPQYRSTTLHDALHTHGTYGWFDASRNIGGPPPETFNVAGWPSSTSGPRLAVVAGRHVIYNDTGHGENYEYIEDASVTTPGARAFCGWKCPTAAGRTVGGHCPDSAIIHEPFPVYPPGSPPKNYATEPCDDGIFYLAGENGESLESRYTLWGMTRRTAFTVTP